MLYGYFMCRFLCMYLCTQVFEVILLHHEAIRTCPRQETHSAIILKAAIMTNRVTAPSLKPCNPCSRKPFSRPLFDCSCYDYSNSIAAATLALRLPGAMACLANHCILYCTYWYDFVSFPLRWVRLAKAPATELRLPAYNSVLTTDCLPGRPY